MTNPRLFTREHFPVDLLQTTDHKGKQLWVFRGIEIPPYHHSMLQEGIDFRTVPNLLYGVVEETVRNLEEIADKRSDLQSYLRDVVKDAKTGRVLFKPQITEQKDSGILVSSVPIIDQLYVGRDEINPHGYRSDNGISINPELAAPSFNVPQRVTFTPELMREYEMIEEDEMFGEKEITCPHTWYRHNLNDIDAIFYRNLVIALDNAVVEKKYGGK